MRIIAILTVIIIAAVLSIWFGAPAALTALGLHPQYDGPQFELPNGRALIVTTSQEELGPGGAATGVFASEMTAPYYAFKDGGMEVDVASMKGGNIPIDPLSLAWYVESKSDKRFKTDPQFRKKVERSLKIDDVDVASYDIVFLAGGWGAAYDLGQSDSLGQKITAAWAAGRVIGGVCHGPLGLLRAYDETGAPLVKGRRITAVTDKQISELGIEETPMHPERDLRAAGALFESKSAFRDIFANHIVEDGRLISGQNQNSGGEVAARMMRKAGGTEAR